MWINKSILLTRPKSYRNFAIFTQTLPGLGDSISSGIINELPVKPGDLVKEGDLVAVIDTDKVSVEIQAKVSGKVVGFHGRNAGDEIKVNEALVDIDTEISTSQSKPATPEQKSSSIENQQTFVTSNAALKSTSDGERNPKIQFTHGKLKREKSISAEPSSPTVEKPAQQMEKQKIVQVSASFGRLPPLKESEIERVLLGGAEPYVAKKKIAKH